MSLLSIINPTPAPVPATPLTPAPAPGVSTVGVSFGDVMDAVNPLQHIPVISGIYRSLTGSTISPGAQITGDTLYGAMLGGPVLAGAALGLSTSVANVTLQQTTGADIASHVLSTLGVGTTSSPVVTPLVPDTSATTIAAATASNAAHTAASNATTQTPAAQAAAAAQLILHTGTHPERTNAQYQRVQAFDAVNKRLVKMAV